MVIPDKGHWVTFPLQQPNPVYLEWWQEQQFQRSLYYVDKCWFGKPNKTDTKDSQFYTSGLDIANGGETLIFIAAELIEERYAGAPHLTSHHLGDRMRLAFKNSPASQNWVTVPIDSKFHYGQDSKKRFRWLVYHGGLGSRQMYQHRFSKNALLKVANVGITWVSEVPDDYGGGLLALSLGAIVDFLSANKGHYLKPFADDGSDNPDLTVAPQGDLPKAPPTDVVPKDLQADTQQRGGATVQVIGDDSKKVFVIEDLTFTDLNQHPRQDTSKPQSPRLYSSLGTLQRRKRIDLGSGRSAALRKPVATNTQGD